MFYVKKVRTKYYSVLQNKNEVMLVLVIKPQLQIFDSFFELESTLLPFDFEVLNEGNGEDECLMSNNACWHKSCALKYNTTELKRARKRAEEAHGIFFKHTRTNLECFNDETTCFFCDQPENKEPLHNVYIIST